MEESINMIECDNCGNMFAKGTGHMCWCKECRIAHPICRTCYSEAKEMGLLKDVNIKMKQLDERERELGR